MSPPILAELRKHEASLFALCWRVLRHRQDAEDAVQEVLLKAARELPRLQDPDRLAPWLNRIALNAALDLRRSRERRVRREDRVSVGGIATAPEEADRDALHRALALLDDDDRQLVIDHYFNRRTLRELADAEGVSEPAVWKRVERAKEKLRKQLAAAAPVALPRLDSLLAESVAPPASLSAAALGTAAAALPAKAIAVAVLLAASAAGAGAWWLRADPPAPEAGPVHEVAVAPKPPPASPAPAARPAPAPAVPAADVATAPYPLRLPPPRWSEARRNAWSTLREKKFTLDLVNGTMQDFFDAITHETGIRFRIEFNAGAEAISFKVSTAEPRTMLILALKPRGYAHAILDDGTVLVGPRAAVAPYADDEEARIQAALIDLEHAARRISEGWNGTDPWEPLKARLDAPSALAGPDTLSGFLERLHAANVPVVLDPGLNPDEQPASVQALRKAEQQIETEEVFAAYQGARGAPDPRRMEEAEARIRERIQALRGKSLDRKDLGLTGGRPLHEVLDRVASAWGLGWSVDTEGQVVRLSSVGRSEEVRRETAAAKSAHLAFLASLDRPLAARPDGVPALVDALRRELGVEVIASESAWATAIPPGEAVAARELLAGFRWAAHRGKLVLLGPR